MRLIDADKLRWSVRNNAPKCVPLWVYETIDEEPTAYDVDKVMEQLKEQKSGLTEWAEDEAFKLATDKAIEIVKQESVSDAVCEWECDGDNLITSCGDYFNLYDNCTAKFKYCPVCGKKIKTVE